MQSGSVCSIVGRLFCALILLVGGGFPLCALESGLRSFPGQAEELEAALRGRVNGLYTLLQRRQWSQAEAYVTKDSLETFRNLDRNPFLGFTIQSVTVNPDQQTATVVAQLSIITQFVPTPVPFPITSQWRLEEGEWKMIVPEPNAASNLLGLTSPESGQSSTTALPEPLKLKGHRYHYGAIKAGEVKVARFPFENITDHEVTITEVKTGCECLLDKTEKRKYQPGESGEIVIEFHSEGYEYVFGQAIVVRTDPGDRIIYLNVDAQVIPGQFASP